MPADGDGLIRHSLWTLEDDFEGRSSQAQGSGDLPAAEPAAMRSPLPFDDLQGQPQGEIESDGQGGYSYTGYVLQDGGYVRKTFHFTAQELDLFPSEALDRVCALVDCVGRDAGRQAEIKRYGKRAWHSPYRPQSAAMQGLDWIFRHDVALVSACSPYVEGFYQGDAATADRWTRQMYDAYRAYVLRQERIALLRLLAEAEVPPQVVLGPTW